MDRNDHIVFIDIITIKANYIVRDGQEQMTWAALNIAPDTAATERHTTLPLHHHSRTQHSEQTQHSASHWHVISYVVSID
jgi:hypothetical protein